LVFKKLEVLVDMGVGYIPVDVASLFQLWTNNTTVLNNLSPMFVACTDTDIVQDCSNKRRNSKSCNDLFWFCVDYIFFATAKSINNQHG